MKHEPLILERVYAAPVEKVWQALTDNSQLRQWYFDLEDFRAEPGFEFRFAGKSDTATYMHLCKVLEVIPYKKLSYSWTYEGYEGYSVLSFELFPDEEGTRLRLTHEGLESFPANNPDFAVKSFTGGWDYFVNTALREFLENKG